MFEAMTEVDGALFVVASSQSGKNIDWICPVDEVPSPQSIVAE